MKSVTVKSSHERVHCRDSEDCEETDQAFLDVIRRHIAVEGDLDDSQRDRIAYIARRCPVHRTLENTPRIEDVVEVVG